MMALSEANGPGGAVWLELGHLTGSLTCLCESGQFLQGAYTFPTVKWLTDACYLSGLKKYSGFTQVLPIGVLFSSFCCKNKGL